MTDIVTRLRNSGRDLEVQAADEIERLRERNAEHEARYEALDAYNDELKAKLKRLQKAAERRLRHMAGQQTVEPIVCLEAKAEVERLWALVKKMSALGVPGF